LSDQVSVENLLDADRAAHEGRVPALSIVAITTWASRNEPRGARPVTSDATRGFGYSTGSHAGDFRFVIARADAGPDYTQ